MLSIKNIVYEWRMWGDPDCARAVIFRYWNALLLIGAGVVFFSAAFVLWTLFVPLSIIPLEQEETRDATETISRERLGAVLDTFEQRNLMYQKLRAAPPRVGDPSR